MAEYRLTPAAEHDLELIWAYTLEQWGIKQADRYIDSLTTAFDTLYGIVVVRVLHNRMDPSRHF